MTLDTEMAAWCAYAILMMWVAWLCTVATKITIDVEETEDEED